MHFFIEQIAIAPRDPAAAKELLSAMGAALNGWVEDHVKASGLVDGEPGQNEANLSFAYNLGGMWDPAHNTGKPLEFEVLHYTTGPNWMDRRPASVSHLGMHCTAEQLTTWRAFFEGRGIPVAQEVLTTEHTNPHIAGSRWYNYVIFSTRAILGVDIKFIVRKDHPPV